MAGVKGRSGRRPMLNERVVEDILDVSANILLRWLTNPEVPEERKIPVVATLIAKRVPVKLEHSGLPDSKLVIVRSSDGSFAGSARNTEVSPATVAGQIHIQP